MLTANHISKSYNLHQVLSQVTFTLKPGERLALVGPNGSGKTTLLRIIAGLEAPDTGTVSFTPANLRLGYLPQGMVPGPGESLQSYLGQQAGEPQQLLDRLESLSLALAANPHQPALQQEFDQILSRLERSGEEAGRIPSVLAALGLGHLPAETPVAHLSGGQKTRLALAGVLLSDPQVLLLDEPTNHLDIEMLEWLEDWLLGFSGGVLFVSHDRSFLDRTITGILELDPEAHTLRHFDGDYSAYLEQKILEQERHWQEYKDQQAEIARLKAAALRVRSDAKYRPNGKAAGDTWAPGFFANRTKGTIRKAKNIEKRVERLMTTERVDKPRPSWQMRLDFGDPPQGGRDVLILEDVTAGYGEQALLENVNLHLRQGSRLALIGPNGSGKTTLLRTITGEIPPLRGTVRLGAGVKAGYMSQEQENLDPDLDAYTLLSRAAPFNQTEVRAFLHQFLFSGDEVFVPAGRLSYGERARLALALLVARGCNLLLLDEPLNHLDIPARTRFEQALAQYEGAVLAVVHDRFFIAGFAEEVWEVRDGQLRQFIQVGDTGIEG